MSARLSSLLRNTASARLSVFRPRPLLLPSTTTTTSSSSSSSTPRRTMGSVSKESPFLQAVTARRTNYTLTPASSIPDARIQEILTTTLENAPSTFGSYTTRLVLLVRDEHRKLWDLVEDAVRAVTPPEQFAAHTKPRLDGFRNAYGTVLY